MSHTGGGKHALRKRGLRLRKRPRTTDVPTVVPALTILAMHGAPVSLGPTREIEGSWGVRPTFLEGVWLETTLWDCQNEMGSGEDVTLGGLRAAK